MRESRCCPPETNNTLYNIVSHIYTSTKYKLQKENADAIPFRLSDLGCCHIPEVWAGRGPLDCLGAEGAGEDVPAKKPCPVDLVTLFPYTPAHNLQILAGPPAVKLHPLHPKDVEPLGWKSFEKPHGLHVSWCWGSHLQPPSLGSPHLWMKAPFPEWCCRNWDVSRG